MERIQLNAIRYFLGVHKFAANDMLLGDVGWSSCHSRHQLALINLWNRIINLPATRLTTRVFLWDLSDFDKRGTWSHDIYSVLALTNNTERFHDLNVCDTENAYAMIRETESEKWNRSRYGKPKLRYYNMFKSSLDPEDYIFLTIPRYHRSLFAQLRAGILPLNVEIGRYRDVQLSDRLCTICNNNEVEDELHFLIHCTFYEADRRVLFNIASQSCNQFIDMDSFDKFVYLMANLQKDTIKFLVKAIFMRNASIYR